MDSLAPVGAGEGASTRALGGGRRAGRAGGQLDAANSGNFGGGYEPDDFKYRRQPSRSAGLEKLERSDVAEAAAVIGGVVGFGFRDQRAKLRDACHAQQEHDKQCFPVVEDLAHYGNGLTVSRCDPQHLGYQNEAASGMREGRIGGTYTRFTFVLAGLEPTA